MTSSLPAFLRSEGYRSLYLQLQSIGAYSPRDSEWNYSDVPHLNVVHTQVSGVPFHCSKATSSSLFLQRIGPLLFPASLYITHDQPDRHAYVLTILNLVISVETFHRDHPVGCCTTTDYRFHYRGPFGWLLAQLARFSTRRNYRTLMREDLPMREQRGRLRRQGVRFALDDIDLIGFSDTTDLARVNVDASLMTRESTVLSIPLETSSGSLALSDVLLRLVWTPDSVVLWPLICPHEGAPLSNPASCSDHPELICPWHGRRLRPLLELDRSASLSVPLDFCGQHLMVILLPSEASHHLQRLQIMLVP